MLRSFGHQLISFRKHSLDSAWWALQAHHGEDQSQSRPALGAHSPVGETHCQITQAKRQCRPVQTAPQERNRIRPREPTRRWSQGIFLLGLYPWSEKWLLFLYVEVTKNLHDVYTGKKHPASKHRLCSRVAQRVKRLPATREARLPSPGAGNGNPLQSSCLENRMDGGAW